MRSSMPLKMQAFCFFPKARIPGHTSKRLSTAINGMVRKMKDHHKEIIEIEPIQNIAFNPPIEQLVWNDDMEEPRKMSLVAVIPRFDRPFLSSTQEYFQHAGQIDGVKTNWDVYQERYGATMKSLKEAIESFNASHIPCEFCPARGHCASDVRSGECTETFAEWAETEAKDETAGDRK